MKWLLALLIGPLPVWTEPQSKRWAVAGRLPLPPCFSFYNFVDTPYKMW